MMKKTGLVVAGVAAALVVSAPFALATGSGHDAQPGCTFTGGTGEANAASLIDAVNSPVAAAVAQAPIGTGGSNIANIGDCSTFLNNNLNGNLNNNLNNNTVTLEVPPLH